MVGGEPICEMATLNFTGNFCASKPQGNKSQNCEQNKAKQKTKRGSNFVIKYITMPKATKLHSKGKTNTIQKPCKVDKDSSGDSEDSMRQFQLELCWCIQQLERSLVEKKGTEKQMQDTWKVLTVLKNNNQPLIRKRQLMRTHFGDYRAKMAAEEKKLIKMASKIKISETPDKPKATFVRKSAFLSTGDSSFRFNFDLPADNVDNPNNSNTNTTTNENNTILETGNTEVGNSNTGNTQVDNTDTANKEKTDETKNFKFSFTGSQFKFNFNVDK